MTRPRILRATMARSLFTLDVALVAVAWPLLLWLARVDLTGLPGTDVDPRWLVYPLADLLLLYAMGLYRREAFVENHRAALRVPMVVGMGAIVAFVVCAASSRVAPVVFVTRSPRVELLLLCFAFVCFTICAFAARVVLDILLRRRLLRRQLLIVGAGMRAWDLLRMLNKEGASLNYDIAFLHDPVLGGIDQRLECDPDGNILHADLSHVLEAAREVGADQIVIAPDERRGMDLGQLLACKKAGFPVVQYLSFVEHEISPGRYQANGSRLAGVLRRVLFRCDRPLPEARLRSRRQPDHVGADRAVGTARHRGHSCRRSWAGVLPAGTSDIGRQGLSDPEAAHHADRRRGIGRGLGRRKGPPGDQRRFDIAAGTDR